MKCLLLAAIVLIGCNAAPVEIESKKPAEIDTRLIGNWSEGKEKQSLHDSIVFTADSYTKYKASPDTAYQVESGTWSILYDILFFDSGTKYSAFYTVSDKELQLWQRIYNNSTKEAETVRLFKY